MLHSGQIELTITSFEETVANSAILRLHTAAEWAKVSELADFGQC